MTGSECRAVVREIVDELYDKAEGHEKGLATLLGSPATDLAARNAYREAAEMLEVRILEEKN